jgi:hypothetical protein
VAGSTSYRLSADLKHALSERASAEGMSETALVTRLLEEGLKTSAHPGVIYRNGRSGRRAALSGGPDIWTVILAVRSAVGSGEAKIADAAEQFGIPAGRVRIAVEFAAENADEIRHDIALNDAAAERVRKLIAERDRLLAS